jgi:HlyD family secretion protein
VLTSLIDFTDIFLEDDRLLKSAPDSRSKSSPPIDSDEDIPASQLKVNQRRQISWHKFGLLGIFVAIGMGILVAKNSNLAPTDKSPSNTLTQTVERKTMPIKISANGIVKAYRSINLSPKTAGTIKTLLVKEGDRVRQGQVIAIMDDTSLRGELVQYQGQLVQQQANLRRLQAGNRPQDIAKAEAQLAEVTANLQQLQAGNRPEDIAQAEAQLVEVRANLQQLQAGNRPEDIAQATARLHQSQATLTQKEVKQSQGSGVYVLGREGKSVFQPIQTGMTAGKQTEVKSGLQGGERILLSPPAEQPSGGGLKFPPAP